jgi:hypothetical protein
LLVVVLLSLVVVVGYANVGIVLDAGIFLVLMEFFLVLVLFMFVLLL